MTRIGNRSARRTTTAWTATLAGPALALTALAGVAAAAPASAASRHAAPASGTVVVKVVTRAPFGKMLATLSGRSLYIKPTGSCTSTCVTAWPRLLMPKGTTRPLGVRCLGTVKAGTRLQVTYRGKRLWKFAGDTGTSVNGNNVGGFVVAKVVSGTCP